MQGGHDPAHDAGFHRARVAQQLHPLAHRQVQGPGHGRVHRHFGFPGLGPPPGHQGKARQSRAGPPGRQALRPAARRRGTRSGPQQVGGVDAVGSHLQAPGAAGSRGLQGQGGRRQAPRLRGHRRMAGDGRGGLLPAGMIRHGKPRVGGARQGVQPLIGPGSALPDVDAGTDQKCGQSHGEPHQRQGRPAAPQQPPGQMPQRGGPPGRPRRQRTRRRRVGVPHGRQGRPAHAGIAARAAIFPSRR